MARQCTAAIFRDGGRRGGRRDPGRDICSERDDIQGSGIATGGFTCPGDRARVQQEVVGSVCPLLGSSAVVDIDLSISHAGGIAVASVVVLVQLQNKGNQI